MSEKDKELVRKTRHGDLILFHHGTGEQVSAITTGYGEATRSE
jgi:hypothetical protein